MIDVSSYQGTVDWKKVHASGVRLAYVKATEGTTFFDREHERNIKGARAAGMSVGAYHYAHPSHSPRDEANYFLSRALIENGDLPPALDLEISEGHSYEYLNDWKAHFLHVVDEAIGVPHGTVFYSYYYFWKRMNLFPDRPVWGAFYGKDMYCQIDHVGPILPMGPTWSIWQYTSRGHVPGIAGIVDESKVLKDLRTVAKTP